ncbi:polysaccharide deacetylase family protein [Bacillus solimangrovi]|uniref:Polysaccharide deacetylase n=1 Tax=Bacillus solimangrovi TaxID=1305675 RepID=A0A1E5LIH5_9BACI|nr:polysaccharide deacetylase family protein [Bacillus solimangrovi]OEH93889.1 polysaccharide deacetylase [Bacillus solimangrovi]
MRKLLTSLCTVILLAGCGTGTATMENEKSNEDEVVARENEVQESKAEVNEAELTEEQPVEDVPEVLEPQYRINENHWGVEPIENAPENVVLLTIDDAPDKHAIQMAETLKEKDALAIFFVNGHFIDTDEEKQVLKQIHDMGFPIGNHTMSHTKLTDLTEEQQKDEIVKLNDEIEAIIGERPRYFRAPFGINSDYSKQVVADENMLLMNWSYGYDWNKEYMNAEAIANIMVNTELLRNGSNLLMHDREWTAAALGQIIDGLREKGYEMLDPSLLKTPQIKE